MRKLLWIAGILLIAGVVQPARADTYQITFYDSATPTQVDGTGTFTFNGTSFSAFSVIWQGLTFDLTAAANLTSPVAFPCGLGCGASIGSPASVFADLTAAAPPADLEWRGGENFLIPDSNFSFDSGTNFIVGAAIMRAGVPPCGSQLLNGLPCTDIFGQNGQFTVTRVPEPGTLIFTVIGLGLLGLMRRKRVDSGQPARFRDA